MKVAFLGSTAVLFLNIISFVFSFQGKLRHDTQSWYFYQQSQTIGQFAANPPTTPEPPGSAPRLTGRWWWRTP